MEKLLLTVLTILLLFIIFRLLYLYGWLGATAKRAVTFIGSAGRGKQSCSASFTACTGWTRRVLRFKKRRAYRFTLDDRCTRGGVTVELRSKNRPPLLLDKTTPTGDFFAAAPCTLTVRFQHADGGYRLEWV